MVAHSLEDITGHAATSPGHLLKVEQEQLIASFVGGKDVFVSSAMDYNTLPKSLTTC